VLYKIKKMRYCVVFEFTYTGCVVLFIHRFIINYLSMEESSSAGPVQIVTITEEHKFVLDEKKLKQILFHKRAIGKKVEN
jgi:hypothetical protein